METLMPPEGIISSVWKGDTVFTERPALAQKV